MKTKLTFSRYHSVSDLSIWSNNSKRVVNGMELDLLHDAIYKDFLKISE
ncbi:MAG: hypothetical protein ACKVI5_05900 [Nitrospinaceae bacterium]